MTYAELSNILLAGLDAVSGWQGMEFVESSLLLQCTNDNATVFRSWYEWIQMCCWKDN